MRRYSDTARSTTLSAALLAADTTIPLASITGWVAPTGGDTSLAWLDASGARELVEYTGLTDNGDGSGSLTGCTRGVNGTTASDHASGTSVDPAVSGADVEASAPLPVTAQTGTAYTLALSDAGQVVELTNAAAVTLTIPPVASVPWVAGTVIELWQGGTGQVTVAPGTGVVIRSRGDALKLAGQYAPASLRYRGADEWVLAGDLSA